MTHWERMHALSTASRPYCDEQHNSLLENASTLIFRGKEIKTKMKSR